jgi:hypothetical protein
MSCRDSGPERRRRTSTSRVRSAPASLSALWKRDDITFTRRGSMPKSVPPWLQPPGFGQQLLDSLLVVVGMADGQQLDQGMEPLDGIPLLGERVLMGRAGAVHVTLPGPILPSSMYVSTTGLSTG